MTENKVKIGGKVYPKTLEGVRKLWEDGLCESDKETVNYRVWMKDETAEDYIERKFNEAEATVFFRWKNEKGKE